MNVCIYMQDIENMYTLAFHKPNIYWIRIGGINILNVYMLTEVYYKLSNIRNSSYEINFSLLFSYNYIIQFCYPFKDAFKICSWYTDSLGAIKCQEPVEVIIRDVCHFCDKFYIHSLHFIRCIWPSPVDQIHVK
jgi:hypothetical protein